MLTFWGRLWGSCMLFSWLSRRMWRWGYHCHWMAAKRYWTFPSDIQYLHVVWSVLASERTHTTYMLLQKATSNMDIILIAVILWANATNMNFKFVFVMWVISLDILMVRTKSHLLLLCLWLLGGRGRSGRLLRARQLDHTLDQLQGQSCHHLYGLFRVQPVSQKHKQITWSWMTTCKLYSTPPTSTSMQIDTEKE